MLGSLQIKVSPLQPNVPNGAGEEEKETLSFMTLEFARGSTVA